MLGGKDVDQYKAPVSGPVGPSVHTTRLLSTHSKRAGSEKVEKRG